MESNPIRKLCITEAVIAAAMEWHRQPTAKSIMAEARSRCKQLRSLNTISAEKGVDPSAVRKYVYLTTWKP